MNIRKNILGNAIFLACGALSTQVQAVLPVDPVLNFDAGVTTCTYYGTCFVKAGSYFGMDTNGSGAVTANERTAISLNDGLKIYTAQPASGSHGGAPDGSESAGIDNPWGFFGNTGLHFTASTVTVNSQSGNTAAVNLSGWRVTWNGIPSIDMGSGAWAGNANGEATITCAVDCASGDTYTLDYSATVPAGDPSGFGNVLYNLHLTGTIGTFNTPPQTSNFSTSVSSSTAVPPGGAVVIDLRTRVSDADSGDGLSSTNVDNTTLVISNPSANIASSCTPTAIANNGDGTITFPACPNGTYTFDFSFADGFETSNTSTGTVNASGDPAPNANDDTATAGGTTPVVIDVLANDTDNNIDASSVAVVASPTYGSITNVDGTTGAITYAANNLFSGTDTFTYTVDDNAAQTSNAATVTVSVNALNTPASSATYAPGSLAQAVGSTTGIVTAADIGVVDTGTYPEDDVLRSCIGGCFDFVLSGLTPGASATVVLPLSEAVPVRSDPGNTITYRKLINGSWVSFTSTPDSFRSAPGTVSGSDVSCPPATSIEYVGLTAGHRCLRLSITDGGPNDADGLADGSIADPGGLGEITRVVGTDGCSMTVREGKASEHADWWLLAAFVGMLGWLGVKRRKA